MLNAPWTTETDVTFIKDRRWTNREQEIVDVLCDGKWHSVNDFLEVPYHISDKRALVVRIVEIRKKLSGSGLQIICEHNRRRNGYRLVRLISVDE